MVEGFIALTAQAIEARVDRGRARAARRARDRPRAGADAQRLPRRLARPRPAAPTPSACSTPSGRSGRARSSRQALSPVLSTSRHRPCSAAARGRPRTAGPAATQHVRRPARPRARRRRAAARPTATRDALGTTMVLLRDPGEVFVLRHTLGPPAARGSGRRVGRADRPARRSSRSPARPILRERPVLAGRHGARTRNGSLHVVSGNHCHRLSPDLELLATRAAARRRGPYNSFVVLADGTLAMKDFDRDAARAGRASCCSTRTRSSARCATVGARRAGDRAAVGRRRRRSTSSARGRVVRAALGRRRARGATRTGAASTSAAAAATAGTP